MNARTKASLKISSLLIIVSLLLGACAQTTPVVTAVPTQPPAQATQPPAQATQPPAQATATQAPTEVPTPPASTRTGAWLDEVVFSVVTAASAVTQLQAGAIDIYASALSSKDLPSIQAANLEYATASGLYYEMTYNPVLKFTDGRLNPFGSAKIREATNWLYDRTYINQEVYAGGGLPKFFPITTRFPDYADLADVAIALENKYAFDPERAEEIITEEMTALGATLVDGKWTFEGQPIVLINLIRTDSDGTRVPIGDYVSNQLESIGFTVDRQYKTSSEASPLWVGGNPNDGLWHLYTGAWSANIIDRDQGDNFQFFYSPSSAYGFSALWQNYDNPEEFEEMADDLAYNRFTSLEERRETFATMLEQALEISHRVWLIDGKAFIPYTSKVEVGFDLAAGVDGAQIWPHTLRLAGEEGGTVQWGQPDLFVDPWNPVAGSNWAFDASVQRGTQTGGVMFDPYTGLVWPFQIERAEVTVQEGLPVGETLEWIDLSFAPTIEVPADALIDWDAENQVFTEAGEGVTAQVKSVVYYPADLYERVTWHDGSTFDVADIVMGMIMTFDKAKEESAIFDESVVSNLESFQSVFKGFKIVSESPLVIEYYNDGFQLDAELNVTTLWPQYGYGEGAWHQIAIGNLAEANGELAWTADKADASEVEWTNFVGGPSLEILKRHLDEAAASSHIPYEPTLGQYITADEAKARYENLSAFYGSQGHFWLGTGPYVLDKVFTTEKTTSLKRYEAYPDLSSRWAVFGTPLVAEVELDGPGQVKIGQEAVYDVFVTFEGEPYQSDLIDEVKILLFDATNEIVYVGEATFVEEGLYEAVLPADVTAKLAAGANKIQVVVVSSAVSIPTFEGVEFVTAP